jgi:carbamate kinase
MRFVRAGGRRSIVTALDQLATAIDGHIGTVIENPVRER